MPNILVIEDSQYQRTRICRILEAAGHQTLQATNGREGLHMAATHQPDCVLLDLIMPEMDGVEVLEQLHARGAHLPVIVVSADIQESTRQHCLDCGAAAFLNKPPQPDELQAAITAALAVRVPNAPLERPGLKLPPEQLDVLHEMINIGVGRAAGILNAMLRSHIVLRLPEIAVLSQAEVEARADQFGPEVFAAVRLGFRGPFAGNAALVFPSGSAAKLVVLLTEGETGLSDDSDLDSIRIGTLTEVGNIILNSVMGSIGNEIKQRIFYSVPTFQEEPLRKVLLDITPSQALSVIWVQTQFSLEDQQINGNTILIFEMGSLDLLIDAINRQLQLTS